MKNELKKAEILFLYETSYNIPNGDPFTGEQRYDEETKKILVSDVRMKRYIRTYFEEKGLPIYVSEKTGAGKSDSKGVLTWIAENRNPNKLLDIAELLKEQIDVKLFGGISTLGDDAKKIKVDGKEMKNGHTQFTGPVQFALLNPSLNEVNLRMHQNTTHFTSKAENTQGSIGTTTLVPYSLMQIHGWVNPKVAEKTGLSPADLKLMYEGLWYGTSGDGSSHSRSKVGQNSVLLLEIEYAKTNQKIYGVDRLIKLEPKDEKKGEQLRSMDDYNLDFSKLVEAASSEKIEKIKFYTEIESIKSKLSGNSKFEAIEL
ncbi:MAG: type I-B CRISPR-associated protein Cas7/Csh2 [Bacteroidetes bacterium RIFOXYA12_FULL_35_11]|nr:MAG: type I-B CRISPR-associated protein Cas7/Csh2 [Bacteroidetes bacterium GWF2_35_48]OFY76327.1 MAG: type I-B CRISPR-associated protein Cas7/Csh2 [Bacteroidetes bacterium RIFOXYA12_FULL_35_11]OFY97580.1 MAG: type I-B CRISPR-associated protein Cas7/Csh2 [Bacteroidetes bacterium RIFOXYB2_FULL_35_7]OFZ04626.1 MAG: type I-B CRISPR-associated protein Cas7/Csh2 [Bacteroidetes bacterium RIFOXYC12_FULL_35_7]